MWTILRTIQEKNKRTHAHYHYRKNTSGREGKALDNIDLNQMSHRYVSGVLQNETSTSAHLIDRSENVNNVEKKSTSNGSTKFSRNKEEHKGYHREPGSELSLL